MSERAGMAAARPARKVIPAFPTARGFGAKAVGGRGGVVCRVTKLADSGSGSLRACINKNRRRTVVFRRGGTIELDRSLVVRNPYLTIAGQTAPGGGIALRNAKGNGEAPIVVATHDVVIRFLRIRPGPTEDSQGLDGLRIGDSRFAQDKTFNVIVDHVSTSWGLDENVQTGGDVKLATIQWSIISEGLRRAGHPEGEHSRGLLLTRGCSRESDASCRSNRISVHHNLMAHNVRRNPQGSINGLFEVVNNVIYNSGERAISSSDIVGCDMGQDWPVAWNAVGNYIKEGPNSPKSAYEIELHPESGQPPGCLHSNPGWELYLRGNIGPRRTSNDQPETDSLEPSDRSYVVEEPAFDRPRIPVKATGAKRAYRKVLKKAGATLPSRDAVDRRVIEDTRTGTGRFIDDPSEVGGWPKLRKGDPLRDSDHDGMPNRWEKRHNLDPRDKSDGRKIRRNGYSNLENYLNQLAGDCRPCL